VKEIPASDDNAVANSTDTLNQASQDSERSSIEVKHEINLAKHVINAGLRTLLNVYHSGYRKATASQPGPSPPPGRKPMWSDGDVMKTVDACWQAFKTIDRLQPQTQTTQTTAQKTPTSIASSQNGHEEAEKGNVTTMASSDFASASQEAPKGKKNVALEMEKIRVVLISRCWMLGMVCDKI
jgi:hypothetical protein